MSQQLPTFVIIGAAKSATSWLTSNLRAIPQIFMPKDEPHYFNRNFERGSDWYRSLFAEARAGQVVGEKSASYLASHEVPERLASLLPQARLIVQFRDPVERAYSDYCMFFRRGDVTGRIVDYLDPERAADNRFIGDGSYATHLARWLEHFSREQILVLTHEDIREEALVALSEVARFLSVDVGQAVKERVKAKESPTLPLTVRRALAPFKSVAAPLRDMPWFSSLHGMLARPVNYPPLTDALRDKLRRHYRPEVATLERMLGRKFPRWQHADR